MISTELVNLMFSSFASFVSKLTNKEVRFQEIKLGEVMMSASQKIAKFLEDATDAFDNPEIKILGTLEPGKIYCLQVNIGAVDVDSICSIVETLAEKDILTVCIDQSMNFVSVPEGYEVVKKN